MYMGAVTIKTVWRVLEKLKMQLPCDPAILLVGIDLEKQKKTLTWKAICTPVFIAALFTTVKTLKQPVSISKQMNG